MSQIYSLLDQLEDKFTVNDGCWEWIAATSDHGYGVLRSRGKNCYAHRVIYELLVGPIPKGLQLDHLCRNRACVNPAHLEIVTGGENSRRSPLIGKWKRVESTTCRRGLHPFPENLYISPHGARHCRACVKDRRV